MQEGEEKKIRMEIKENKTKKRTKKCYKRQNLQKEMHRNQGAKLTV